MYTQFLSASIILDQSSVSATLVMIMSHRKVHSHGSIPFSWEDEPGICKTPQGINQFKSSSSSSMFQAQPATPSLKDMMKIPLPPCGSALPPRRTDSGKGFRWKEDPFLVAYKEIQITKSEKISGNSAIENKKKKSGGFSSSVRKSKCIFSCKSSSGDVRHGNFLKLSELPRLPRDRARSFKLGQELQPDFNYETWL